MSLFYFLATFLLLVRLKKQLVDPMLKIKWDRKLSLAAWGTLGLGLITMAYLNNIADWLDGSIGSLTLLGVLFYINKQPDFSGFKFFLWAHVPLVIVGIVTSLTQIIAPTFYETWDTYFDFAGVGAFVWIFARWINSKKQREELKMVNFRNQQLDVLVAQRTTELTEQKNELQNTVELLKATQAQLIQQEKLASLGELTAGIAHEIQNPLNFVNNFSEVSMELVDEMGEELAKGDTADAMAIANDIKQNLEKIIHHGKRADGIVKGMLQHSRASTGAKEPTDINALADEYLRLAYHGLRAKDKSFNAELVTNFDAQLPKASVMSQDIGRVLLNLFTNAFYATQQKKKTADSDYRPIVEVTTTKTKGFVEVKVKDNGIGIPEEIKDKIMQPFFTTKPTGEGTGLGLSLSYDIVVKGHGGSIKITSVEREGSEFMIQLPIAV